MMETDFSVYVFEDKDQGFAKVGFASDPITRVQGVEAWHPRKLNVPFMTKTEHHRLVERVAHTILADYRVHGEWFRVDTADAILAVKIARRHVESVNGDGQLLPNSKLIWLDFMEARLLRDLDDDDPNWPSIRVVFSGFRDLLRNSHEC